MKLDIKYLKKEEKDFPEGLRQLKDCPDVLYVLGDEKLLNSFSIAVVGARRCTLDGERVARQVSAELSDFGIHIVSGLAYGIDSIAHEASLGKKGKTVAVLAYGMEYLYKNNREKLYEDILEKGGVIVSEYLPEEPPNKIKFHKRNRIIAALSQGVLVVEARKGSGSLITADYAKELGKDIFVVPGSVFDENYIR